MAVIDTNDNTFSHIDTNDNTSSHIGFLKNQGVTAVGRYYSSSAGKRLTKQEAKALSDAGLQIFVVFENRGDPELSVDSGVHDAQIALQQAVSVGQPEGSAIYFAMEHLPDGYNASHLPGIRKYFNGLREVLDGKYQLGVYSDGVVCDTLLREGLCEFAWLSASTAFPGSKEFYRSGRWALAQRKVDLHWSSLSIDTNEAKDNFGAFRVGVTAPVAMARASVAAAALAAAPAFAPGPAVPATGWALLVQRLRTEHRASKPRARTVGTYQAYMDGQPVTGLAGMTVEREGPGDNGPVGKADHRCIEAGIYPLRGHDTENYATVGFETDGDHPRPAVEVGDTANRTAILIHPASGYGSTIGCINLAGRLADADSDFSLADSTARVIALIDDLKRRAGGTLPRDAVITNCHLVVVDPPIDQIGSQPLHLGSRGPLVRDWQAFLAAQGFRVGSDAEGSFGTGSRDATIAFQSARGLGADGAVGPRTIAAARQLGFGAPSSPVPTAATVGGFDAVAAATDLTMVPQLVQAGGVVDCDVVIQAGHEDTPDDKTGGVGPLGNEIDWTPIVANEAVRLLRQAGVNAVKETAHIKVTRQMYRCKLALFLHFDDPGVPTESGPSVGYSHPSDAPAAEEWKTLYKEFFPFNEKWHHDNFTEDEHHYYGFKFTATSDAEFLIEFGDLHSLRQARWLKPRLTWLGSLVAHYVSRRIGVGSIAKPAPFAPATLALAAAVDGVQPVGSPAPFHTKPSPSGNENGSSLTSGLNGTMQDYSDGSIVIEATEALRADREGWQGTRTLTAVQRRVEKNGVITIEQRNYSYATRQQLPIAMAWRQLAVFPGELVGFNPTDIYAVRASQFGKNDREDEGTGSSIMGLIQTNSEVFGASLKVSALTRIFGPSWRIDPRRLAALIEVLFENRLVRVPLVDVGPHEDTATRKYPEVDLTWACDQFLNTDGQANVKYRVLLPA